MKTTINKDGIVITPCNAVEAMAIKWLNSKGEHGPQITVDFAILGEPMGVPRAAVPAQPEPVFKTTPEEFIVKVAAKPQNVKVMPVPGDPDFCSPYDNA